MALAALLQDDVYAGDRTSSSTTPPTANDVNAIPSSPTATSSSSPTSNMTVFHALEAPSISVRDYVHRLSKYAFCSPACLITAMYYMSRVVDTHANLALTSLTVHRLLITALVLACKYLDDMNYNLSYYAKVGGLPTKELANLELHMLRMLDFHLGIPVHLFNHLEATLVSRVAKLANQPHYPHQNTNVNDFGGDPPCVVDRLPTDEPMQTQKVHQRQSPNHSPRQQQQQQQPNPATEIAMGSDDGGVVAAVAADRTAIHLANKAVALLDGDLVERFASLFDDLETAGLGSPSSSSGGSDISHVAALLYSQTISMHQHGGVTSTCPRLMVNNNNNNNGNAAPNDNNSTAEHAAAQMLQQQQGKSGKGLPPTSPVSDSLSRNSSTDTLAMAAATIISGGGSGNVPVGAIAMQTTRPADDGVGKGDNNAGGGGGRRTTLAKPTRRRSSGSGQLRLLGGAGRDMSCRVDGQNRAHRPSGNTPPLQRRVSFSSSKK